MHIAYEGLIYEMMPLGGISRYFDELLSHLPDDCDPSILLPKGHVLTANQPKLQTHYASVTPPFRSSLTRRLLSRYWRKSQWRKIEESFRDITTDVRHWTYYCGLCQRPITSSRVPNVVTVYDFIAEHYPEIDPRGKHRHWLRQSIQAADRLICISETTHLELCERYPDAEKKATVIPLGNSFAKVEPGELPNQLRDKRYILFVGRRNEYKNFSVLWKAWKSIKTQYPDLLLVSAGPPLNDRECRTLKISREEPGFVPLDPVPDSTLKTLYAKSQAFIFPSRMEGFGLPALEAIESGSIVLASDCAALKEVCGDSAYYFQSHDDSHLAELIEMAVELTENARFKTTQRGKHRASSFCWKQVALQTAGVYRSAIADHQSRRNR